MSTEVKVPDIGDFDEVPVIEVHVAVGDTVNVEDPLVTLESDKAAMDVPSPVSGVVKELKVAVDDKVSEGTLILVMDEGGKAAAPMDAAPAPAAAAPASAPVPAPAASGDGVTEVKVPDIGDFDDVPVIEVHVAEGDTIAAEDPLVTLESDKAAMDVPAPAAGVVKSLKVSVGDKVSEGSVILLLEGGSDAPAAAPVAQAASEAGDGGASKPAERQPDNLPDGAYTDGSGTLRSADGTTFGADSPPPKMADFSGVHASPSVRRLARELDIDLNKVTGTGEKGRITKDDVKGFMSGGTAPSASAATSSSGMGIPTIPKVDFSKFGSIETVEMPRIKKISGPVLHRSWLNIPHVTHCDDADITDIDGFRKELDTKAKEEGYRVTLLSFLIKASVVALKEHWEVNSSLSPEGDALIRKHYYNIGFAADTPGGLMVPVIKDADRKGIKQISIELGELSKKAREGALRGGDMQGASFTISSLGGIGGTSFTPIVNAPEVAILGVARSKMAPVWDGKEFQPRNMLPLCLSYDHRAIDGALAARFCVTLKGLMADPRNLLL